MANADENNKIRAKRAGKDSVFTDLFSDPKYLFELYKTLHPEDTKATVSSIKDVTLKNVLTNNIYNDIGFIVGERLLILIESQSTWTTNILVRVLLYLSHSYHQYLFDTKQDFYHSVKVRLPKPEIYVVFTGDRDQKPKRISLSKEFFTGQKCDLEIQAEVIYETGGADILNQYIMFCKVLDEQIKAHGQTLTAVEETIKICSDKNILKQYLENRRKEVITLFDLLFNEEVVMELHDHRIRKESEEIGERRGIKLGEERGIKLGEERGEKNAKKAAAKNFYAMGTAVEKIAQALEEPVETVREWLGIKSNSECVNSEL